MKKFNLTLALILTVFTIFAQDVIVSLTGQYDGAAIGLDSIYIENMTNSSTLSLTSLPGGVTTYQINLSQGIITGTDEIGNAGYGISAGCILPGKLCLNANLTHNEELTIRVFDLFGKELYRSLIACTAGNNHFEVNTGASQVCLVDINGNFSHGSYKVPPAAGRSVFSVAGAGNDLTLNKSANNKDLLTGFTFSQGNEVRFTACKAGMHSNSIQDAPVNGSEYFITLSIPCPGTPTVTDADSNVYNTVQIGTQCWMRENLNVGVMVESVVTGTTHSEATDNGTIEKFCPDNNETLCSEVGGLYTWDEMMQYMETEGSQGICPDGWHVPSNDEWTSLVNYLGGSSVAAAKLKSDDTNIWGTMPATNESGFTALTTGQRGYTGGFSGTYQYTYIWSSTQYPGYPSNIHVLRLGDLSNITQQNTDDRFDGNPIRCIKN